MTGILHAGPGGNMNDLVHEFNWPTLEACQDLGLPMDYQYMITGTYNPSTITRGASGVQVQEGPQESAETLYLRNRIAVLEAQVQRSNQAKITTKPVEAKGQQVLADYLGFTDNEKTDELVAVFGGDALDRFIGLEPEIKDDWKEVKTAFLHMHAQGSDPTLIAYDELKTYRQGDKPMKTFGPEITSLLQRAGIYQPSIQLDYLKDRLKPELEQAVILRGAKNLVEGINIATEIERSLMRAKKTISMGPIQYQPEPVSTGEEQQNYQQRYQGKGKFEGKSFGGNNYGDKANSRYKGNFGKGKTENPNRNKKCHKCGKMGHIKRDCWSKGHKQNAQELQVKTDSTQPKREWDSEEDGEDIFAHIMANNNQDVKDDEDQVFTRGGERFKLNVLVKKAQVQQDLLVDTGSTVSTISRATVDRLGLEEFACQQQVIKYGNTTTQEATSKAILDFTFNSDESSRVFLLIVPSQNEEVILGMDWLQKEDILLHPKDKRVYKNKTQASNNADLMVEELLSQFPQVTREDEEQSVTTAPYTHSIDTGNATPTVTRDFRRSPAENEAIRKEVEVMLKKGVIVPSSSEWCSPVVLIKKPDGSFRFCVDYRNLNKVTVKDKFPLPLISDLLEQLQGYSIFSICDLKSGFWQLPLNKDDGSAKKTAFQANGSLYEWVSMPYGCVNGPASFSRLMTIVLRGLERTIFFCDDVCIFSKNLDQHKQDVARFLDRLAEYNLCINPKKCQWFSKEVKFLGFLVSGEGIRSNPEKVKVVKDWKAPANKKGLLRFLGFAVFYHKFIDSLSSKAKPLYALLKKDVDYSWTQAAQQAFEQIKQDLVSLPTLAYPNPQLPYDLHCDASDVGLGACVVQLGRPIAFASRTLNSAETNYSTTEKECLAIVWALKQFHPYLYGSKFTIYTDHAALKSILSTKLPRGRLARWIMALQEYQPYDIVHKKGILNTDADALSRIQEVNAQDFELKNINLSMFQELQKADPTIRFLLRDGVRKPYVWHNGLVCCEEEGRTLPFVPVGLIEQVLNHVHSKNTAGHFGVDKTLAKAKEIGWWPNRGADIANWVQTCDGCQRYKVRNDSTRPPMRPITPRYVGEIWATDIATLPESYNEERYLLVVMEYLSK
ncbi:hypothetical protein G6F25_011541 [Rhizopus arrhizus]|nr:hypothetical protein G6F25_011541 [Rhizopus arrhizus]KAG1062472.1 hypothetical protein G6F41_011507 [Rhizopus arrhizus]